MSKFILVVGHVRSGTSAVAGVLRALGVFMGRGFLPAGEWNPAGDWSDLEFKSLHLEATHRGFAAVADRYSALVQERREHGAWGLKCHALLSEKVWPDAVAALPRPDLVIRTERAIEESVASLELRRGDRGVLGDCRRLVLDTAAQADRIARSLGAPVLEVRFGELVRDAASGVSRIAAAVGLSATASAVTAVRADLHRVTIANSEEPA
ncbi:hypothetical protein [Gemmata sp.]|uniref:hypothetical protein n=1 Tax=Gemmata sp. TaxID=1914242 RepID=UPI003F729F0E